jgi:hypothetical protein
MDVTGTVLVALWILVVVTYAAALVDVARRPGPAFRRAGRSKGVTWMLVFLTGIFGAAYWFLRVRREVARETPAARDAALAAPTAW